MWYRHFALFGHGIMSSDDHGGGNYGEGEGDGKKDGGNEEEKKMSVTNPNH